VSLKEGVMAKVTVRSGPGLTQEVQAGAHALLADEPAAAGGTDAGPDPYALLLAALGACTSMTLRLYAARKGWDLREVVVELDLGRAYAEDCAHCEDPRAMVDQITRRLTLHGALDATQRARLAEIATKCPVHKTLVAGVRVKDEVVAGA
jgi:putative redox protein